MAAALCLLAPNAFAAQSNPPWYPSLMGFEHYDSGRSHLFDQATFGGSWTDQNRVIVRPATTTYPTGYNLVYLSPDDIFLYGGCYGNIPNATGAFVAKVDPDTLEPVWSTQLINTIEANEWDYPGVLSLLDDGFLYVVYGYRVAKLDPRDGSVVAGPVELPTLAAPRDTSYNGFDALEDGTIIAKTVYRQAGCTNQGPNGLFNCPNPKDVPPSLLISIDPRTLQVLDQVTLPGPVGGRPTTTRFQDQDYVYMATTNSAVRYLVQNGHFTLDNSWNPGNIYQPNQTLGSAVVIMNDWFVVQCNGNPAPVPLSVIVINQADANRKFVAQPFAGVPASPGLPPSWAPFSVSVDPDNSLIYAGDSSPGMIAALKLTADGLQTVWTAQQRTTEFFTLIGPANHRVVVSTEIPDGQLPLQNTNDSVVWRDAGSGRELARTPPLPAMTSGTMIQPYYFGNMLYMGLEGDLIELAPQPAQPPTTNWFNWGEENYAYSVGLQAYIYGFPWLNLAGYRWQWVTQKPPVAGQWFYAPLNQFYNASRLATATAQGGGSPNNDTLYSSAWIDLTQEPVILSVPAMDRYYTFEMSSMDSDNFGYVGLRATGGKAGNYAILGPNWHGVLPAGVTAGVAPNVLRSRTPYALILGRTAVFGPDDLTNVYQIQGQYKLTPLSYWGTTNVPPANTNVWAPFDPATNALADWMTINKAMTENPPNVPSQQSLLDWFADVGIGPGQDVSQMDSNIQAGLARAAQDGYQMMIEYIASGGNFKQVNGWSYPPPDYGRAGQYDDFLLRATFQCLGGIVANDPVEATYLNTVTDGDGKLLSGTNRYTMRFAPGGLPDVAAFWSVTLYDANHNLVANSLNRYKVGTYPTNSLTADADGGLTIYLQSTSPGADKESNWLPTPTGTFNLILRCYMPGPAIVNQTWAPPPILRVTQPAGGGNSPWFPSLMAFEHYDSGRSHLFEEARFNGSFEGNNAVAARVSPGEYLTPYNVVYLNADSMYVFGGGYGDKGGTGSFVARVDPSTLSMVWSNQLINTVAANEWDYPGVLSALADGYLYLIYGYRLAKLDPRDGSVVAGPVELPTLAAPRDTAYNGLDGLPDGTLIAKTVYRAAGCTNQGFSAFLQCPGANDVTNSIIVALNSQTLQVIDQVEAEEFIGGRITCVQFAGKNYIYLPGATKIYRYLFENQHLSLDTSWGPVLYRDPASGQNDATAVVVMNDWVVFEDNATPVNAPPLGPSPWMTVMAINQADAAKQFTAQPFKAFASPPGFPISFSPSAVTVDPLRNWVYALDAGPGVIGALELRDDGFHTVWTEQQRTTEFLALIGPQQARVLVGTEVPVGQPPAANTQNRVIWREAETGRELARSDLLPAVNTGTMVEPGYSGRMYYLSQAGKIIELTVLPSQGTLSGLVMTNNMFKLTIPQVSGLDYIVQVNTNLSTTNWVSIATNTAPFTITDSAFTNNPQRFYRAIYKP